MRGGIDISFSWLVPPMCISFWLQSEAWIPCSSQSVAYNQQIILESLAFQVMKGGMGNSGLAREDN